MRVGENYVQTIFGAYFCENNTNWWKVNYYVRFDHNRFQGIEIAIKKHFFFFCEFYALRIAKKCVQKKQQTDSMFLFAFSLYKSDEDQQYGT